MKQLVIGLAGEMLSGKTLAASFFVEHFNAKQIRMSALLNKILDILDLPTSRENQIALANMLRDNFGEAVLATSLLESVKKHPNKILLIDGIRKISEAEVFKAIKGFKLVFIDAPAEKRFKRMKERGEKTGEQFTSWEEFLNQHNYPTEVEIPKLKEYADFVVSNDGNEQALFDRLTQIVTEALS